MTDPSDILYQYRQYDETGICSECFQRGINEAVNIILEEKDKGNLEKILKELKEVNG